ncbi:MAG: hypothetical protein FJX21_01860 [Alphaproteobacteria bacterium]|nr:hypothetical protein [Alphaproteobacteria bacterium]
MPSSRTILAFLVALLVSACGDLPRPFQPDDKSVENPLLVLGDRAGIVVMPLAGIEDDDASQEFASALAKALRDADVIAHNGAGSRSSLVLSSFLERKPGAGAVIVLWLSGPDGSDIGTFEANVLERDLAPGAPRRRIVLQRIAETVVAQLNPAGGPAAPMPAMAVARIAGLPAAQASILERAMAGALRRARMTVTDAPGERDVVLAGSVDFAERPRDHVALDILWKVFGTDGKEIGQLRQRNEIPGAALQRGWPEIAGAIADGAVDGIVEIAARAQQQAPRRR